MSVEFIKDSGDLSEILNKLRSEEDSERWELLTNEKTSRRMLLKTKGMTEKLVDSAIFAVLRVRKVNKNRVALGPILGKDGSIHCVICNKHPVVCAVIIPSNTGLEQEDKDLSFASFTCEWHAINPKRCRIRNTTSECVVKTFRNTEKIRERRR